MTTKNCVRCRKEIPSERLEALPETMVCVSCSAKIGGETVMIVSLCNTAKAGSMKKNYGGVDVTFRRKSLGRIMSNG